jgi:hypothetical protein
LQQSRLALSVMPRVAVQNCRFPFGLRKAATVFRPFKKPPAAQGIFSDDLPSQRRVAARSLRHCRHAQI